MIFHPSVPVGVSDPWVTHDQALSARVSMVLETRPGTLPWRPDFGCDLSSLVGRPATPQRLNEARWRVEEALARWIPEVEVVQVQVNVVPLSQWTRGFKAPRVPLAESALLSLGVQAALEVEVELKAPMGPVALTAVVSP